MLPLAKNDFRFWLISTFQVGFGNHSKALKKILLRYFFKVFSARKECLENETLKPVKKVLPYINSSGKKYKVRIQI